MPQSLTDIFHRCLSLLLPTEYIRRYFTESSEIFTVHATITDCHSVGDYRCKYKQNYSVGKVLAGNFFWRASLSVRPSVFFFIIFDRISDGKGNYRRSIFRRTDSVGKNFTDKLRALHQRNESVGKTV
jgi:hypothetical protein